MRHTDHRGDHALGLVGDLVVLDHALARAGLAEYQAQSALLGVDQRFGAYRPAGQTRAVQSRGSLRARA